MTKIEELKAAYAAATPGEPIKAYVWEGDDASGVTVFYGTPNRDGDLSYEQVLLEQDFDNVYDNSPALFEFIALAHNLMPQLLEAVELLKELRNSLSQYDDGEWYLHDGTEPRLDYIDEVLEKLK